MLGSQLSGDWSISSITRKPSGGNWIIRKPRSLWTYHPGVNPADMLNIHLQNRADMARDLSEQVTFNGTFEGWVELENASAKLTRAIVKRRNVIAILFEFFTFGSHPRSEWWGEYGRKRNR
jgi:hypothetical protein